MIYSYMIENKNLIYKEDYFDDNNIDGTINIDEEGNIIDSTNEVVTLGGLAAGALVLFVPVLTIALTVHNIKKNKEIKDALKNYETIHHTNLIKYSDMTYKLFKIDKKLFKKTDTNSKKKEDLGNIFNKLFKTTPKDTKADRICEYFYEGKPAIAVLYQVDTYAGYNYTYTVTKFMISFADKKFEEHKDYYSIKACIDRKMLPSNYKAFLKKYGNNNKKNSIKEESNDFFTLN